MVDVRVNTSDNRIRLGSIGIGKPDITPDKNRQTKYKQKKPFLHYSPDTSTLTASLIKAAYNV